MLVHERYSVDKSLTAGIYTIGRGPSSRHQNGSHVALKKPRCCDPRVCHAVRS